MCEYSGSCGGEWKANRRLEITIGPGCHDHPSHHLPPCLPPRGRGAEGAEMKTEGNLGVLGLLAPRRQKRVGEGQGGLPPRFRCASPTRCRVCKGS
jgi:hypothetical protein